jgi:pimeloyl-ACP methyl ester carboxylesterase
VLYPFVPRDLGGAPNLDRRARRVRIPVGGGDALDAWHLAGTRSAVVLVFHGFGRNHLRSWRYGAFLNQLGFHVVVADFRSSRFFDRKPTTLGHFELVDAESALAWIRSEPVFAGFKIGVFGESLGGTIALMLAGHHPEIEATVVDCPFTCGRQALEDACERWARLPRQPSADMLRTLARHMTGRDPAEVDALGAAARLAGRPAFFIHGLADNRLSPEQSRQLWRAAGEQNPLWLIAGAGHNEGWKRQQALYEQRVGAFFTRHLLAEGEGLPAGEI